MNYKVERWNETNAPDAARLRRILESEGYSVYQWSDSPNAFYPTHIHGEDQSHWIISGTLELTIENIGTFTLESGDRDFMPANTKHSARVVGNKAVVYLIGAKR